MENFEQILKKELGIFEKHFVDFKEEMKNEMSDFKTEMKNEMSDFKTEVKDEIRDRFFCFEQDYGKKIDAIYDKVILDKEMTDIQLKEIKEHIKQSDLRIFDNSVQINSIKGKNVNSNLGSKKLNSEV